jgi:LemA protein
MSVELIIIIAVLLLIVILFNSLIAKRNAVNNAFAGIDAYLKKRYDLIPNLVAAVQKYMEHERGLLNEITELRSRAISGNISDSERVELDNIISRALGAINIAVENYPDLKANTNFLQLQASLNEVEEQLSAARRAYNAAVNSYNNAVQMFPTNLVAMIMGFKARPFFEASEAERQNVNVKNLFNS